MPYAGDKKGNQLTTILPQPNHLLIFVDPVSGIAYQNTVAMLKSLISAAGNLVVVGTTGQLTIQDDVLIGMSSLILSVEGAVLVEGPAYNEYQFNNVTGTITFGQPIEGQTVNIYYFA